MINQIFGKSIEDITLKDIKNHFATNREESDVIEYKSFHVHRGRNDYKEKEKAILKTICAFLNSSGGILIWGAPVEEKDENGDKYFAGELSPVDKKIEKDNFISKIVNRVTPVSIGIKMKSIPTGDGKCVVIFSVPESNYKPHRFDDRYWMRLDGQSKVAPHHYVEALFKQIRYPNIEGYLKFLNATVTNGRGSSLSVTEKYIQLNFQSALFNFSPFQNEEKLNVRIFVAEGEFFDYFTRDYYTHNTFSRNYSDRILHYGSPLIEHHCLFIKKDIAREKPVELTLLFGGLKSPLKSSKYILNFRRFNPSFNSTIKPLDEWLTIVSENITPKEEYDQIGKNKRVMVNSFLKRK